jgi:hypothetical protein
MVSAIIPLRAFSKGLEILFGRCNKKSSSANISKIRDNAHNLRRSYKRLGLQFPRIVHDLLRDRKCVAH